MSKPSGMAVHGGSDVSVGVIEAMRYATQKSYLAWVAGTVALDEQLIDAPLLRYTFANDERRVRVDNTGKPSQTWVTVLERLTLANGQAVTLVEAQPRTGRTHQYGYI